jgi:type I restriction enzyme S subunit
MNNWKQVSDFVNFSTKGITPKYVESSTIIVLNQKCIRNGRIDYSLSQYTDDTKQIAETKFVKRGDILINSTGTGTAGRCAFVTELPENHRLITDSHILILRCHSYNEAQCLSYLLFSFEKTLMSFMTGSSGQSELDKVVLLNLKTKLPTDSYTQQKIAKVLSDLDAKIGTNNRINTELEAMAKTLYDYWFV